MSIETRMSAGSEADISRCGKPCLLCPRKRTFGTSIEMSAKTTSGHPQNNGANRKTASRRSLRNPIRYFIQCASRSITGYQICNLSPLEKCKVKSLPSCTVVAPTAAPPVTVPRSSIIPINYGPWQPRHHEERSSPPRIPEDAALACLVLKAFPAPAHL